MKYSAIENLNTNNKEGFSESLRQYGVLKVKKINKMFSEWPFNEDDIATVYWITSPVKDIFNGSTTCIVYFINEVRAEPVPVLTQWGAVPELWIGRRFRNGVIVEEDFPKTTISISVSSITDMKIMKSADAFRPSLYSLYKKRDMCLEYCVVFLHRGMTYIIPCIELARVLYMDNSLLANQLLTDGGLDELITPFSWKVKRQDLSFDFSTLCKGYLSHTFALSFVYIYCTKKLRDGWKSIYVNYANTKSIITEIPLDSRLILNCAGITKDDATLITSISLPNLTLPFKNILYGPQHFMLNGHQRINEKTIESNSNADNIDLAKPDISAKNGSGLSAETGRPSKQFGRSVKVKRKATALKAGSSTHKIELLGRNTTYSPNDRTGKGSSTFINLEPKENLLPIKADPDFSDFCKALNELSKSPCINNISISYGKLPIGKSFSTLSNRMHRRYAIAEIFLDLHQWLVIELCIMDGYSISTLFIRHSEDIKELTNKLITRLMKSGGHWGKSCFDDNIKYQTLEHFKGRSPKRWAKLMLNKMITQMHA